MKNDSTPQPSSEKRFYDTFYGHYESVEEAARAFSAFFSQELAQAKEETRKELREECSEYAIEEAASAEWAVYKTFQRCKNCKLCTEHKSPLLEPPTEEKK